MKSTFVETVIGAAVIVIAVAFFTYAYKTSGAGTGSGGYTVMATFEKIDGVSTGTDVRMSGIKVGTVSAEKLNPETYEAVVSMTITPDLKIPDDSTAKITSEGLLGGNYITLEPGGSETMVADGGMLVNTQGSIDLLGLLGQAIFSSKGSSTQ